jgi:energy-coupling factor transporter ATP-binding protein EcfA2
MQERIAWALSLVGMAHLRQRSPFQLSGGQKQRVAIAAMLAMRPQILVLDEPTANLDPVGKREVFTAVQSLRQQHNMTIIMVSHESEQIAEFADRVVVLHEGKIVLDGTPTAVFPQLATMPHIGLAIPQVTQLAHTLNLQHDTNYAFVHLEEAVQILKRKGAGEQGSRGELRNTQYAIHHTPQSPISNLQSLVSIKNLHFNYDTTPALQGVSAEIGAGELVAIIGQNGSGKTTLAKHLNGLLRPSQGHIHLFGENISGRAVGQLARSVGYVFQNPDHQIFSPTVREEIAVGPRNLGLDEATIHQRVENSLAQFGLLPYADEQPALLSFGLRRKVSVAAVVAMDTPILVLDEPTTGLDWRSATELMAIVDELVANGRTVLLITHDMRLVADYVPRCLVMQDGRLLADGPTRHIFQQDHILYQAQLHRPQITELAHRLGQQGTILTVDEFCSWV